MVRLSTGSRINSANDDVASFAIHTRMATQVIELAQSTHNASYAIAMVSMADEVMSEVIDLLQRIREISVQGANGALSSNDSTAIDKEVQALQAEALSIMGSAEWNENKIFDGTIGTSGEVKFILGSGNNQFISHTFDQQTVSALDLTAENLLLRTSKVGMTVEKTTAAVSFQPSIQYFNMIDFRVTAPADFYERSGAQDTFTVSIDGEHFTGTFVGGGGSGFADWTLDDIPGGEGVLTLSNGKEILWQGGQARSWEDFTLDFIEFDNFRYIEYISSLSSLRGVHANKYVSPHPLRYGPSSYFEGLGLTNEGPDRGYGSGSTLAHENSPIGSYFGSYSSPSVAQPEQWSINLGSQAFNTGDIISVNVNGTAYTYTVAGVDSDGIVTSITEPNTRPQIPNEPRTIGLPRQEAEVIASVSGGNILLTADRSGYEDFNENLIPTVLDSGGYFYSGQVAEWDGSFDVSLNLPAEVDSWRLTLDETNYAEGHILALQIDDVPHIFEVTSVDDDNKITGITQHDSLAEAKTSAVQISKTSAGNAIYVSVDPPNVIEIEGSVANDTFAVSLISATNFGKDLENDTIFSGVLSGVSLISAESKQGASKALATIDKTIEALSASQAANGSTINSLLAQHSNLAHQKIAVRQSLSLVSDTNYATETSKLAAAKIVHHASSAMLAQANASQEAVFALLKEWLQ